MILKCGQLFCLTIDYVLLGGPTGIITSALLVSRSLRTCTISRQYESQWQVQIESSDSAKGKLTALMTATFLLPAILFDETPKNILRPATFQIKLSSPVSHAAKK